MASERNQATATERDERPASGDSADFIVLDDTKPPARIELGRERRLLCRLYLGLIQTMKPITVQSSQTQP